MKVIKSGSPPKPWTMTTCCSGFGNGGGGCCAQLEIGLEDLYQTCREDLYGDVYARYITFTCVECGVETDIEYEGSKAEIPWKADWRTRQEGVANVG